MALPSFTTMNGSSPPSQNLGDSSQDKTSEKELVIFTSLGHRPLLVGLRARVQGLLVHILRDFIQLAECFG